MPKFEAPKHGILLSIFASINPWLHIGSFGLYLVDFNDSAGRLDVLHYLVNHCSKCLVVPFNNTVASWRFCSCSWNTDSKGLLFLEKSSKANSPLFSTITFCGEPYTATHNWKKFFMICHSFCFKLIKLENYMRYQFDVLLLLKLQKISCYFGIWPQKSLGQLVHRIFYIWLVNFFNYNISYYNTLKMKKKLFVFAAIFFYYFD